MIDDKKENSQEESDESLANSEEEHEHEIV